VVKVWARSSPIWRSTRPGAASPRAKLAVEAPRSASGGIQLSNIRAAARLPFALGHLKKAEVGEVLERIVRRIDRTCVAAV
jgi:hypothetical protein